MKSTFVYTLAISLLAVTSIHTASAQEKILTEPIELIKATKPTFGNTNSRSSHATQICLDCPSTYNPADFLVLVDGKERALTDPDPKLKPDSIKSVRPIKHNDPGYASYWQRGFKGIILVETHKGAARASRKKNM